MKEETSISELTDRLEKSIKDFEADIEQYAAQLQAVVATMKADITHKVKADLAKDARRKFGGE